MRAALPILLAGVLLAGLCRPRRWYGKARDLEDRRSSSARWPVSPWRLKRRQPMPRRNTTWLWPASYLAEISLELRDKAAAERAAKAASRPPSAPSRSSRITPSITGCWALFAGR